MKTLKLNFKFKCEFCKIWLPLIAVLVIGFYVAWQFVPTSATNTLKIAVGGSSGAYYDYAKRYQQNVQVEGLSLEIVSVAGSVEALQTVKDGKADLALVQGGVAHSTMPNAAEQGLHSIASLFYEPLWVFYRKELGDINHLNALRGKRLSIGKQGSGTQVLVSQLLADNDITANNSSLQNLLMDDAQTKLAAGEIDAMFLMTLPTAEIITKLISSPNIALMDFQRQSITYTSHYPFLNSLILGEGIIDLKNNLPDHNVTMLTTAATLVASKDIHPEHVRLFSREAHKIHSQQGLLEKPREFPSIDHLEIPIHPIAEQYLQKGPSFLEKIFPFWLASRLDQLKVMLIPLLTLLIPLSKGIMPLYQWRIRSRIYPWYKTLSQLDRKLDSLDLPATEQEITRLNTLHGELANTVSVPLAHMPEFYQLRTHADHILTRLKERRTLLLGDMQPITPVITIARQPPQNTPEPNLETGNERNPVVPQPIIETDLPQIDRSDIRQQQHHQARKIVRKHMLTGMALSAVPIPLLDVATLTSTQLHLLDKLSQHYDYAVGFDKKLAKAKLLALLSSALPTTTIMGLSSLSKLIPGIGTLGGGASLSALSGAVIYATGNVFIRHYENGGTLENFDSKQQTAAFHEDLQTRLPTQRVKAAA
jgi:TRAP transporter TAXI family solute receptor